MTLRLGTPQKDSVIIYSPSGYSKPVWLSSYRGTQKKIFRFFFLCFLNHTMKVNGVQKKKKKPWDIFLRHIFSYVLQKWKVMHGLHRHEGE